MTMIRFTPPIAHQASRAVVTPAQRKRSDWRFLLAKPKRQSFEHFLLLGGSEFLGRSLIESGTADRVTHTIPSDNSVDAAAILDGAQVQLEQVANCLKSGATVYYECLRPMRSLVRSGIGSMRSYWSAYGLALTGIYWVLPGFWDAKRYIALDLPNAVEWYLNTFYIAAGPVDRLLEICLRLFARHHSERLVPFARSLALTAVKEPGRGRQFAVMENIPETQDKDLRSILLTSGQDESSRLVILPFVDSNPEPVAAVKISTHPRFNGMTRLEQDNLAALRRTLDGALHDSVPEPWSIDCCDGNVVAVQSYMRGRSLWVSCGRWQLTQARARLDLQMAANWLARFHRRVQFETIRWNQAAIGNWLEPRLEEYAALFELSPAEERLWTQMRDRARALTGKALPCVWQHNDFGLWNLYRYGDSLAVIDWESSHPGLPLCDLIYLVTHWIFIVRRYHTPPDELRGISELCTARSQSPSHARFAHQVIADYLQALEIDAGFLPILHVYNWVDRAIDRVHRQEQLGNPEFDRREGNRFVAYVETLAKEEAHLFEIAK